MISAITGIFTHVSLPAQSIPFPREISGTGGKVSSRNVIDIMVASIAIIQFVILTTFLRVLLNLISSSCVLKHVNGTIMIRLFPFQHILKKG